MNQPITLLKLMSTAVILSVFTGLIVYVFGYHGGHPNITSTMFEHDRFLLLLLGGLCLLLIDCTFWRLKQEGPTGRLQTILFSRYARMLFWSGVAVWLLAFTSLYVVPFFKLL